MSDLIDRQSVLNAFDYWVKSPMIGYTNGLVRLREMFEELPSVTQEHCEDAISMDKTIVQLSHLLSDWDDDWNVAIRKCIETVKGVQPVTPAEKVGHWIKIDDCSNSGYYCSECRKRVVKEGWSDTVKIIKYCPNCGSRMMQGVEG